MSPGFPTTLSIILKPLLCASVIWSAEAVRPGAQCTCRFTHVMPAYFILSGTEKSLTCPPSSHEPEAVGGAVTVGEGVAVAPGLGVAVAVGTGVPLTPGIVNACPAKIRFGFVRPFAAMIACWLTPNLSAMLHKVSPR